MIGLQSADKYSSCLSCGSDKDVYAVIMQNPHSRNTLEVTLCSSCLLVLMKQMQYNDINSAEDSTINAVAQKVYAALDALDRGTDNDWARVALEEANQILDVYYKKEVSDNG